MPTDRHTDNMTCCIHSIFTEIMELTQSSHNFILSLYADSMKECEGYVKECEGNVKIFMQSSYSSNLKGRNQEYRGEGGPAPPIQKGVPKK